MNIIIEIFAKNQVWGESKNLHSPLWSCDQEAIEKNILFFHMDNINVIFF